MKSWLIWKDPDAGKDWGQEEKGRTGDEMVGWHHCLNGHEFGWTPGAGDGQGGLACCDSWGRKELNTTEWLNWTEARYRCGFSKSIYSLPVSVWHLSHYLVNCHNISKILVFIMFYGDLWSVIFAVTVVIVLRCREAHPNKTVNFIYECCVPTASPNGPFPSLCPLASLFPEL